MMFKNYKPDLFFGVMGIAICGIVSFGIIHVTQSLTLLLTFFGMPFLPAFIAASILLVVGAVVIGLKKKDKE